MKKQDKAEGCCVCSGRVRQAHAGLDEVPPEASVLCRPSATGLHLNAYKSESE